MPIKKLHTATFLAILFHVSGCIGILFTPYKDWFIANTPLNLCLMALLLLWCQPDKNSRFFLFFATCFIAGIVAELIGVHTGMLFGHYQYGGVLGTKIYEVPLLIGINWFLIIFCSASAVSQFQRWLLKKIGNEETMPASLNTISFIVDGALLTTVFDWIMEPAAVKLGFWQWADHKVPFYNYICWFLISALLLILFRRLPKQRLNQFAVHLLIIQLLFFLALRNYSEI